MRSLARAERAALCDLLDQVGPDAPTLCDGWVTRDLAVHLAIRERRPDAALGMFVPPLSGHRDRVQEALGKRPWRALVQLLRGGPPVLSAFSPPPVDAALNAIEFFVHHEDVRRAQDGWQPRELPEQHTEELWRRMRTMSRLLLRKAPVGIALRRSGGVIWRAHQGSSYVTVAGPASELVLYAFGRTEHAQVKLLGDPADIEQFRATPLGF
ncbi:MAG: TIGR03085 family protein [Streptosporangiales bacterium]|nr:TIGR03085 family protein [Streptosporangiales bacterium]